MKFSEAELAESRRLAEYYSNAWAPIEMIAENLGIDIESLGGTILNLASGYGLSLELASAENPDIFVVSYDLDYYHPNTAKEFEASLDEQLGIQEKEGRPDINAVAGYGQILPFKNQSFDMVISHAGIPAYLPQESSPGFPKHLIGAVSEMIRVTKQGGKIISGPIHSYQADEIKDVMKCAELNPSITYWDLEEFMPAFSRNGEPAYRLRIEK